MSEFYKEKHVKYFTRVLCMLPTQMSTLDSQRLTIVFFCVSALDVLDSLHALKDQKELVDWIYSLQIVSNENGDNLHRCGFTGGDSNGDCGNHNNTGHVAMTYCALSILLILGDDLSRVDRKACLEGIKSLQLPDGGFKEMLDEDGERDMRFIFCACCVATILNDFSCIDVTKASEHIASSFSYDGGFGQGQGNESHGGSTFCAVASLKMMGKLEEVMKGKKMGRLRNWLLWRQRCGFHGRPHKDDDSCYTFWIGASLKIIGNLPLVSEEELVSFVLSTQDPVTGGMAKWPQVRADPLHSYMGLSGLSLIGGFGLEDVEPTLNITKRSFDRMKEIHEKWGDEGKSLQNKGLWDEYKNFVVAVVIGLLPVVTPKIYHCLFPSKS